jgi:stage II sporulation protein D
MRSTAFTMKIVDDVAVFDGRGWGHGVGLCQWGSFGQALLGRKHEEILKFYYRGAEVRDYHELV